MKFTFVIGLLAVLCVSLRVAVSAPPSPHILIVLADDMGWSDLGYQGSEIPTPAIDAFAEEGVFLNRLYAQPLCSPSRVSLMTGRYPARMGLNHIIMLQPQAEGVPTDEVMLPEKLKSLGYSTHAVGKWHLGFYQPKYRPTNRGFDTHFGFLSADIDYFTHGMGRDNICDPNDKNCSSCFYGYDYWDNETPVWKKYLNVYSTFTFNDKAISRIKKHPSNDVPFFLYLSPSNPHTPLEVDDFFLQQCNHIDNETRRIYCGQVVALDSLVKNVTDALKEAGMWEDTLFYFQSDNGGEIYNMRNMGNELNFCYASNYPLRNTKGTVWEGGIRVPGFFYGKGVPSSAKGTVFEGLMHISDIFPTLIEGALGADTSDSKPLDGYNAWDAIMSGSSSPRTEVFVNSDPLDFFSGAYIVWPWKIVVGNGSDYQIRNGAPAYVPPPFMAGQTPCTMTGPDSMVRLYNIEADPSECHNVVDEHPDIAGDIVQRLLHYSHQMGLPRFPFADPNANPKYFGGSWSPWQTDDGVPLVGEQQHPCTCDLQWFLQSISHAVANRGPGEC